MNVAVAEDDSQLLDDDVPFDATVGFDDAMFGAAFDKADLSSNSTWLEDFTIKMSQQFSAQVSSHSVDSADGDSLRKESELETNRFGINIRYQNAFAAGWLVQASGHAKVFWNNDYEFEASEDTIDTEFRVNELFIQRSVDQHSLKVGRQTIVWGETSGNSVLDIINTTEFRDFTIIDIEDARLNQWMLVWDYFAAGSSFSSFVNLYPEFNPATVRGSPFFSEPVFNLTDYDRDGDFLFETGTQWSKSFEGSDIAFMAAYLYENQLRYEAPDGNAVDAVANNNDFLLLGFSANKAIGKLLLNVDLAYSHGVLADIINVPGTASFASPTRVKKNQLGLSFGFEYGINNDQSISLGIQAQKWLNEGEDVLPGQSLINDGVFGGWLLRYSNSLMNGDWLISSTVQGDLEANSLLLLLGVDYTINDNWAINSQLISISANEASTLSFFDEDVRLAATITYSF